MRPYFDEVKLIELLPIHLRVHGSSHPSLRRRVKITYHYFGIS